MVEIGGRPILWHIMKHYARAGLKEFVVALGYKGEVIKRYFLDYHALSGSSLSTLRLGRVARRRCRRTSDWNVHLVDTGVATRHGGRLKRLAPVARATRRSCSPTATASADVDLRRAADVPSRARQARHRSPPCVRPSASARWCSTATRSRGSPRSRRSARAGSTAASWCSSREVLEHIDGDDDAASRRRARAAGRAIASWWRTGTTGSGSAWTPCATCGTCARLWEVGHAPWKTVGVSGSLWRDRPVLVTGATGLLGGWLVAAPARRAAPTSSASYATGFRRAGLLAEGTIAAVERRRRRRARPGAAGAGARRVRGRHGLPPRRADDRRHREPQPGVDLRGQHQGHVGRCSRRAAQSRR